MGLTKTNSKGQAIFRTLVQIQSLTNFISLEGISFNTDGLILAKDKWALCSPDLILQTLENLHKAEIAINV